MRVSVPVRLAACFVAALGPGAGQEPTAAATPAVAARIVELAPKADASLQGAIREPAANSPEADVAVNPALPRRSQFVIPDIQPPALSSGELPPDLSTRPDFSALPLVPPELAQPALDPPSAHPQSKSQKLPDTPVPAPSKPEVPSLYKPPAQAKGNQEPMRALAQQAAEFSDRGFAMAQRGMLYAGRAELIKALQLVTQALDVQDGSNAHTGALAAGLAALEEAREFSATAAPREMTSVDQIAVSHRTPLLKSDSSARVSALVAQQQYYSFAQAQLAVAAGSQPVASLALYRLGRIAASPAARDAAPHAMPAAQAMVFHQAALAADAANYLAANELGVLLARYGQLDDARRLLLHSVRVHPQVETWHNLAIVHRRLGEEDLARRAEVERDLVAKQTGGPAARRAKDMVRWVDPPTFAASGARDVPWPETTTAANAASNAVPR